jgi:hypothetical protein
MTQPADQVTDGLQHVLAAQHLAIYAYPLIGVLLTDDSQITRARALEATHRLVRDAVRAQLIARSATPVASATSYLPAKPVTDAASAQQWGVEVEQAGAAAYRYFLATTAQTTSSPIAFRQQATAGLNAAALEAGRWQRLLTPDASTVPFPGLS